MTYVYPSAEPFPTAEEKAYECLRIAASEMGQALGVLEGWDDDFGSRSISEGVWEARDRLRDAVALLPGPRSVSEGETP